MNAFFTEKNCRLFQTIITLLLTLMLLITPTVTFPQTPSRPDQPQSLLGTIGGTWTSVGPSPEQNCPYVAGGLCSGRVTAITPDPAHPGTIYIGGAVGGVWKTTNGGSTWTPMSDNQPSLAIGSIAIDSNGNVLAGTGDGDFECGSYYGAGILKSTDGGNTWAQIGATTFARGTFGKLAVNPNNPNVILAAISAAAMITTSAGDNCTKVNPGIPQGVYISRDGGSTWTNSLNPAGCCGDVALVLDPTNASIVYAGALGGVYKSTDGGSTWTGPLGGGLPPTPNGGGVKLDVAASSHLTVYAAMGTGPSFEGQLYRTTDGGTTWSNLTSSIPTSSFCDSQCASDMYVAVDPTDPNTVYLGGLGFWRTTNGGGNWTELSSLLTGQPGGIHLDQHTFAFSPGSHTGLYVGNDGGIWYSPNANTCSPGSCWTNLNAGLAITQFQAVTTHPTNSSIFFGGAQDNGAMQHVGTSTTWKILLPGDAGATFYDRNNPSTLYTQQQETIQRSDNGGGSWTFVTNGISGADFFGHLYDPMAMDPNTPTTLYWGTGHMYKTTNRGDNWTLLTPGLSVNTLSAITVARSNSQYVYAGTTRGQVFISTNGGNNFTEIDTGFPVRCVTKIAVDPANANRVAVTLTDFGGKHIFLTNNAGSTWTDITSNLPDYPADSALIDAAGTIYIGTDIGVFVTENSGTTWSTLGTALPRVPVFDLVLASDGTLLAATYGRSVWALPFDFTLSNGGNRTVVHGHSVTNQINVTMAGPSTNTVSLSCSGLPSKSTCSFSPAQGYPTYTSTMTIITSLNTPTGSFTITVAGSGGGKTHTSQFILTVTNH
jgi:photosystem II stability/assembly factor-like uncharacterized protein